MSAVMGEDVLSLLGMEPKDVETMNENLLSLLHAEHAANAVPSTVADVRQAAMKTEHEEAQRVWSQAEKALKRTQNTRSQCSSDFPASSDASPTSGKRRSPLTDDDLNAFHFTDEQAGLTRCRESLDDLRARTHLKAQEEKAKALRIRASEAGLKNSDHGKRRLRVKICDVLRQVMKRQELHREQRRVRQLREEKHQRKLGCKPDTGDATLQALGLPGLDKEGDIESAWAQGAASPRRTAILESLSLAELELLRKDAGFYFRGPVAVLLGVDPDAVKDEDAEVNAVGSLEVLADFFAPLRSDRALDVAAYRQKLLARAAPTDVPKDPPPKHPALEKTLKEPPKELERMPCQGRHPPMEGQQDSWGNKEFMSPTLSKVRETFYRREAQDQKWVEEKRNTMVKRIAKNMFKAREQQREIQLQCYKSKELHKVRTLEAEERKAIFNVKNQKHKELMATQKLERIQSANDRVDELVEDRRDKVTAQLEQWQAGRTRAQQRLREQERARRKRGAVHNELVNARLERVADAKLNRSATMSQRNAQLADRIQLSLQEQLAEQRRQAAEAGRQLTEEKQRMAAQRREQVKRGSCYDLLHRAMGEDAYGFDTKFSHTVDRRSPSWRRSAKEWQSAKGSFSMPSLHGALSSIEGDPELEHFASGYFSNSAQKGGASLVSGGYTETHGKPLSP